jgi:1-acyl-sn-glycerol-3-phosphate acyltransferase
MDPHRPPLYDGEREDATAARTTTRRDAARAGTGNRHRMRYPRAMRLLSATTMARIVRRSPVTTSPHDSTLAADAARTDPRWARAALNRWIFRGMLASMGSIAVVLHRTLPWESVAWDFAKLSARNLGRLCGVRVRVHGLEHLTGSGPYVFTPNHQSHFDIAALLGWLPGRNRFVAKKELFAEPVLGTVLRTLGMIPVDRDNPLEAIERLNAAAAGGSSLIVFPEGTRSRDGTLLPFKKGPFIAALHLQLPIVPVVCCGTREVMPKGGYLAIVPGDIDIYVEAPIATRGLGYEDRDALRVRVRDVIAGRLAGVAASRRA